MSSPTNVSILPLGGLGEFGMNAMLVECGGDMVLIDIGMTPSRQFGIDMAVPDIGYLIEQRDKLRGIVLTHGHEDHIGALWHVLKHAPAPVYGTDLTLELAKNRLKEWGVLADADLNVIDADDRLEFGNIACDFLRVSHSFPNTMAAVLRTPIGTILHTSDFKLGGPLDADQFDAAGFALLGEEGVLALLSDSTNIESPGFTPPESSVRPQLTEIFRTSRRRIIASTFASSLRRIQQLIDLAMEFGRQIAVAGRSMVNNTRAAAELGHLWLPSNAAVDLREAKKMPPDEVMILLTGSQGEPFSALSMIADGSYGRFRIEQGDAVILSARVIPGCEKDVARLVDNLYRRGAEVYYGGNCSGLHASGHGYREDLRMMIQLTRPRYFIPIHGDYKQLRQHARLAEESGVSPQHIHVIENGERLEISEEAAEVVEKTRAGRILVDGQMLERLDEIVLRDRRQLSEDGMAIVIFVRSKETGELLTEPEIVSRGFVYMDESEELMNQAKAAALDALDALPEEKRADQEAAQEAARLALRRFFSKQTDRRPVLLPVVLDV